MKLYHRTPDVEEILQNGFKDSDGYFKNNVLYAGVWFSSSPSSVSTSDAPERQLVIDVPEEEVLEYELRDEKKLYREFLIPAPVLNSFGKPSVI